MNIFVRRNSLEPDEFWLVFPGFPEERPRSSVPEGIRGIVARSQEYPVFQGFPAMPKMFTAVVSRPRPGPDRRSPGHKHPHRETCGRPGGQVGRPCHINGSVSERVGREGRIVQDDGFGFAPEELDGGLLHRVIPSRPVTRGPGWGLVGCRDPPIGRLEHAARILDVSEPAVDHRQE